MTDTNPAPPNDLSTTGAAASRPGDCDRTASARVENPACALGQCVLAQDYRFREAVWSLATMCPVLLVLAAGARYLAVDPVVALACGELFRPVWTVLLEGLLVLDIVQLARAVAISPRALLLRDAVRCARTAPTARTGHRLVDALRACATADRFWGAASWLVFLGYLAIPVVRISGHATTEPQLRPTLVESLAFLAVLIVFRGLALALRSSAWRTAALCLSPPAVPARAGRGWAS
ncbi:hypothetical protein [Amycolatopsis sp. NPDC059021]|uniref:hypothetical protein n=1 Tax=Amycolatopsis sp. NPDC059021 TaxID=3346704 RepID=UPI0036715D82